MRKPWTVHELEDVSLPWEVFSQFHPARSYDSWEVKRRRVSGGSAGSDRRTIAAHRKMVKQAERALRTIAEFLGVDL